MWVGSGTSSTLNKQLQGENVHWLTKTTVTQCTPHACCTSQSHNPYIVQMTHTHRLHWQHTITYRHHNFFTHALGNWWHTAMVTTLEAPRDVKLSGARANADHLAHTRSLTTHYTCHTLCSLVKVTTRDTMRWESQRRWATGRPRRTKDTVAENG